MVSEKLVTLPDRLVAVIGTDHGMESFPGQEQTEKELTNHFGLRGPHAIVLDSLPRLEEHPELIGNSSQEPNFLEWALQYSASRGIYLIGADPANISEEFERVILNEELVSMLRSSGISITQHPPLESAWIARLFGLGALITLGIGIGLKKRLPTRREFLAGCLIGIPAMAITLGADAFSPPLEGEGGGVTAFWIDEFGRQVPVYTGSREEIEFMQQLRLSDLDEKLRVISQTRELGPGDYDSGVFGRVAGYNSRDLVYGITLRNAIYAEAMTQPIGVLVPLEALDIAKIAAVVGGDHLIIPPESRISWLLTHDEERNTVIKNLIRELFLGLQETDINLDNLKSGLSNLGRRYLIDSETGELETYSFPIPALERALEYDSTIPTVNVDQPLSWIPPY